MPESNDSDAELEPRIATQVNRIVGTFKERGIEIACAPAADRGVDYVYAEGQLLVREQYLNEVYEILNPGYSVDFDRVTRLSPGVSLITQVPSHGPRVFDTLRTIDRTLGVGIATPNHVLTVAPGGPCPATEPEPVYFGSEPYPPVSTRDSGAGVLIYIADTGLFEAVTDAGYLHDHPWLAGVRKARDPDGTEQHWDAPLGAPLPDGTRPIPPYAGHGTFVAGVARCMAPHADVIVSNVFRIAGSALESDFVLDLNYALELGVDIFNLSITAPTRAELPLLGFDGFLRRLHQYKGVICVVAAGNDGRRKPTWPAAYPGMLAVGALGRDWHGRASFSNHGGWVDVYAPGRDLVNAYTSGTYVCDDPPYTGQRRQFHGMASWSGTSFSTPLVTGLIAARMSRTGEDGQQAAAALLAEAQAQAIPGVGAILLPHPGQ